MVEENNQATEKQETNTDVYKRFNLTGKKLTQQEVDLIVTRFKKERTEKKIS